MPDPALFIKTGGLIFNPIFSRGRKAAAPSLSTNVNYSIFINKIFICGGTNHYKERVDDLLCFRFVNRGRSMKIYSLNQHFSAKSSLTVTSTAGIFQSQTV